MILDETVAIDVVRSVVAKRRALFSAFPEYDAEDDLVNESMAHVRRCWSRYDANRGAAARSFIWLVADRHLLHLLRGLNRRRLREARAAVPEVVPTTPNVFNEEIDFVEGDSTTHFLADTHRRIRLIMQQKGIPLRGGTPGRPHRYDRAQSLTLLLWMQKHKLSIRSAELQLRTRPDLARALNLSAIPSLPTLARLKKCASQFEAFTRGGKDDHGGE